jgi:hypothetical protein
VTAREVERRRLSRQEKGRIWIGGGRRGEIGRRRRARRLAMRRLEFSPQASLFIPCG